MTEFNPKQYLAEIKHIDEDIRSRQEEIDSLRQTVAIRTSSIREDKVQETHSGSFDDRYAELLQRTEKLTSEMKSKIDELVDVKIRISNEIDMMDSRISRIILRERYINLKTYEDISELLSYDLRHIYKLHGKALEDFKDAMLGHVLRMK